jgi:hypothetical protein
VSGIHIEMPRGTPVTKPKPEPQPADVQLDPRKYLRIMIRWLPIKTNMHLKFGAGRRLLSDDTLCLLCDTPSGSNDTPSIYRNNLTHFNMLLCSPNPLFTFPFEPFLGTPSFGTLCNSWTISLSALKISCTDSYMVRKRQDLARETLFCMISVR